MGCSRLQVARCGGGGGDGGAAGEGVGRMGILEKEARRREGEGENCVIARVLQKVFVRGLKDDDAEGPRRARGREISPSPCKTSVPAALHLCTPFFFDFPTCRRGVERKSGGGLP